MIDISTVTDRLRAVKPDCGWLMLVDGRQKLHDRDFTNAAELLGGGTCSFFTPPRHPLMHMYVHSVQSFAPPTDAYAHTVYTLQSFTLPIHPLMYMHVQCIIHCSLLLHPLLHMHVHAAFFTPPTYAYAHTVYTVQYIYPPAHVYAYTLCPDKKWTPK